IREQSGGDLGLKMLHALSAALAEGRGRVCIGGRGAPTRPAAHFRALLAGAADVRPGPCDAGGYYALSRPRTHAEVCRNVEWASPAALAQTEEAAARCGLSVERGPAWYDIDRPQDLLRLHRDGNLPPRTARWFEATGYPHQRSPAAK